ncbi:MAG: nodulation protein NfeD, partial [Gemmatimonadetes bacterium]|nr:nodulation protein NfeD [Gemmatimonadota bacterium]
MNENLIRSPKSGQVLLSVALAVLVGCFLLIAAAAAEAPTLVMVTIEGTIDLGLPPFVERALAEAEESGAEALILEINTLGGRVDAASRIRDLLLDAEVKTVAYINKRAISAGALISLACEEIVMAPGSTIGAATPVTASGNAGQMEKASEKVVSYFRSEMRATAEQRGRPPEIAEAMVDESVVIDGVTEEGKLLTLTTDQAVELGIADRVAPTRMAMIEETFGEETMLTELVPNWAENVVRFFTNPILSGFLLSIGFLGILMELRTPGFGIPGAVGIAALALFFGAQYIVQLAGNGEIILFALGLILVAVEIFVIPGFGIAGIIGIGLLLGTTFNAMIPHIPAPGDLSRAATAIATAMVGTVAGTILLFRFMPRGGAMTNLILEAKTSRSEGFDVTPDDERDLEGAQGETMTEL